MRSRLVLTTALAACFSPAPHRRLEPPRIIAESRASADSMMTNWSLDVRAAVAYALAHGPLAEERRDLEAIAEAKIGAARQLDNPEVRIGHSTDESIVGPTNRWTAALRLHTELPWAIGSRIAQARSGYDAERAATDAAKRALVARIEQRYLQLAFERTTQQVLDEELEIIGQRRRVIDEQVRYAAATRLELAIADLDLAEVTGARSAIDVTRAKQLSELAALIGVPAGQTWEPVLDTAALRDTRTGLDRDALVSRALGARPELAEAASRADAAEAASYVERTRRIPWFSWLQVEERFGSSSEWAISATIGLPLFSLNSGRIAVADAERRRYLDERARLAAQTVREVGDLVDLVEQTGRRARELQDRIDATEADLGALLAQERSVAVSDPVKLLLLEEHRVRARRAVLEAAYDHCAARIALQALVGDLP
jgi:outer membrane protein TolC